MTARPFPPPVRRMLSAYLAATVMLTTVDVLHVLSSTDPALVSRAALQMLTCLSLLPTLFLTLTPPSSSRPSVLATFLISLALLIDALLRLVPCLQTLFLLNPTSSPPLTAISVAPAHLLVHLLWLFLTRHLANDDDHTHSPSPAPKKVLKTPVHPLFSSPSSVHPPQPPHLLPPCGPGCIAALRALRLHATCMLLHTLPQILSQVLSLSSTTTTLLHALDALLCVQLSRPVLRNAALVLLHATPQSLIPSIPARRDQVLAIDGVLQCSNLHIWQECPAIVVGTLCVSVHPSACKHAVLQRTVAAFDGLVDDLTVQVESWGHLDQPSNTNNS